MPSHPSWIWNHIGIKFDDYLNATGKRYVIHLQAFLLHISTDISIKQVISFGTGLGDAVNTVQLELVGVPGREIEFRFGHLDRRADRSSRRFNDDITRRLIEPVLRLERLHVISTAG